MRKLIGIASLLVILTGCEKDQGYSISGKAEGIENGKKIYISELTNLDQRPERVDSTTVKDGKFEADLADTESPNLSYLEVEGVNGMVLFISENENIDFTLYKDSLQASKKQGGKQNELLNEYLENLNSINKEVSDLRVEMRSAYQSQDSTKLETLQGTQTEIMDNDKVFKKQIIKENKDAFVSLMAIMDLLRMQGATTKELKEMYNSLNEEIKNTALGTKVGEQLESMTATEIGSKAPDFSALTPEGEKLALNDVLGKVTIVDFWASWCKPCRKENPNVVKVYNKYHEKGLNIIAVSLDKKEDKDKWLKAIEDDGLVWNHVSNLQAWNDPIAKKYGVRAIPATFILDENGVIVDRDVRGEEALDKKIEELLASAE
ncbi:TlpA disulfide reductase family protein [Zunongwangia endophytica]|uniref:Redoxin domain-containing protein n=1 Tax=Zunongwangia endophytica TaxID=1808945 RepID=A0ABV8H7T5_9FLAO|nr:TlpA disulfide reductase family protein [Zunongwangia endophytica]MDN3593646.1 TlpA disulfide reductase family protein [Zunongwangia endophytica]